MSNPDVQQAVARLQSLLLPPVGCTNETKIYQPVSGDPNAEYKRQCIEQAYAALHCGLAVLANESAPTPQEANAPDYDQLASRLSNDAEHGDFAELSDATYSLYAALDPTSL